MREIKFRMWNKKLKGWMFDYKEIGGFALLGEITLVEGFNCLRINELNDLAVMQFTGLKDKNGEECYEGDIVKNGDYVADADAWNEWTREVEWIDEEAKFIGVAEGERWEVIGNIYENPELLNPIP